MTFTMHFLWMAALHSEEDRRPDLSGRLTELPSAEAVTHVCTGSPACSDPCGGTETRHETSALISNVLAASYAPDELFADGAEGGLREERRAELVAIHHVYFGLLDGASPLAEREHAVPLLLRLWDPPRLISSVWNHQTLGQTSHLLLLWNL